MTKAEYLKDLASRRKFVNLMLTTSFGAMLLSFAYPVLRFLVPPRVGEPRIGSVEVPWNAAELKLNSGRIFKFGSQPGILIKTPTGELRAFTAICTHLACTVQYREDMQMIWCACHNGHYDLFGKNVAGPPPRPLEPYKVQVSGDGKILVSKA
ncbi:MAG TPA: ubiquinol-cytochrome c reductase iron-sulfur subunit [Candidatus Acidoferrum sp.]|nr:ubiquinol-cytochrome c reductase iron-sulfur subunit [Candidatus Acidoferrum sp.]